jgi:hypothetical protein
VPYSVQDAFSRVKLEYADLTRDDFLRLNNKVFKDLCAEFAIQEGQRAISTTAGVYEYPLLETELVVSSVAFYQSGPTDWNVLDMSNSYQDMEVIDVNWRLLPPQRPMSAWVYAGNLFLYPAPNITTPTNDNPSAYYPQALMWLRVYPGDLGWNSNYPIVMKSDWPFVTGVKYLYAASKGDQMKMQQHATEFEGELTGMERYLGRRALNWKNQATPEQYQNVLV